MASDSKSRRNLALATACLVLISVAPFAVAPFAHAASVKSASEQPLTSLQAIHELSNSQASHQSPVAFEATVTYYRGYERTLFVQDGDLAIYVQPKVQAQLSEG